MKINTKGLALITVLLFLASTPSLQAYTPDNEFIQLMSFKIQADHYSPCSSSVLELEDMVNKEENYPGSGKLPSEDSRLFIVSMPTIRKTTSILKRKAPMILPPYG